MKKYELTDEILEVACIKLYRIRALVDIPKHDVKIGDLGGFVESEENLSHLDNARVTDNAWVSKNVRVTGNARVKTPEDYIVIYPIGSECGVFTAYRTENGIGCNRGCFSGTIEEFEEAVKETHDENKFAKEYKKVIELVKLRLGKLNDE